MMRQFSRRSFFRAVRAAALCAASGPLIGSRRAAAEAGDAFDLENDVLPLERLPRALRQRAVVGERTGPLGEGFYAVHVSSLEARPGRTAQRTSQANDRARPSADDEDSFARLAAEVNAWFDRRLSGRRLRFIYHGALPVSTGPQPDADPAARLLQGAVRAPAFGGSQRVQILLVRGIPNFAGVIANTVLLGWPAEGESGDPVALAGPLAHLIGHALGLAHPRADSDTAGTGWASEFSFMHPGVAMRGLADSLILDSPLNPEKARLVRSGFFPYQGIVHTGETGAIPLQSGMIIEGDGQEVRIAHGNYVLSASSGAAALIVRGANLTVDLGGALLRGDDAGFEEFGQHRTCGVGVSLLPAGDGGVTLRGGIITGYHYGVKGEGLHRSRIEGVTLVDNRRLPSDARRPSGDKERGVWLDFWLTPEEDATEFWGGSLHDDDFMAGMGAGVALLSCQDTLCSRLLATHNTVGIADYFGQSNRYEDNDLGGCPMGLRFWQARGGETGPIVVARNRFTFNTQPEPWWWSHGDSAAVIAAGVEECLIEENQIAFAGDGLFLSGFPRFPAASRSLVIRNNVITHCYAHGVELDFAQDCRLEGNRIVHNWLSGVWAGHTAGVLVRGNTFTRNNRGRMYGGWTDTQGAISSSQGRVVVHRNTFEDNWVGVNLWQSEYLPWRLFAGTATGHTVTGNTFRNNRAGVRMKGVTASEVAGNLMQGNQEDLLGDLAGNQVADNGPAADPGPREAWFFPVETLLFDRARQETDFSILWLRGDEAFVVPPDELTVRTIGPEVWLDTVLAGDGRVHLFARAAEQQGFRSAQVEITAREKHWRVPVKAMCGDFRVIVGRGDLEIDAQDLSSTPVGPAAIFGLFPALSDVLRSALPTGITGSEPFWCRFLQPESRFSEGATKFLAVVYTDGAAALRLGENGPGFAPEPPGEDQYWLWNAAVLDVDPASTGCRLDYVHGPELVEKRMPSCVALWLYPLDDDDLARPAADQGAAAPATLDYLLSMPGRRRDWPRPQ